MNNGLRNRNVLGRPGERCWHWVVFGFDEGAGAGTAGDLKELRRKVACYQGLLYKAGLSVDGDPGEDQACPETRPRFGWALLARSAGSWRRDQTRMVNVPAVGSLKPKPSKPPASAPARRTGATDFSVRSDKPWHPLAHGCN